MKPDRLAIHYRCRFLARKWDDYFQLQLREGIPVRTLAVEFGLEIETVRGLIPRTEKGQAA